MLGGLKTKLCAHQDPGTSQETQPDLALSVSCGGMGQQWPALGTGALAAADMGGVACKPNHRGTEQTTNKLKDNYAKEILTLL